VVVAYPRFLSSSQIVPIRFDLQSPPNLPLQAALVNDLCSVQNGRERKRVNDLCSAVSGKEARPHERPRCFQKCGRSQTSTATTIRTVNMTSATSTLPGKPTFSKWTTTPRTWNLHLCCAAAISPHPETAYDPNRPRSVRRGSRDDVDLRGELSRSQKPHCAGYSGFATENLTTLAAAHCTKANVVVGNRTLPRPGDQLLDEHRFCALGNLVVGNLDRITNVNNVGN
jgi:hypothetical protein